MNSPAPNRRPVPPRVAPPRSAAAAGPPPALRRAVERRSAAPLTYIHGLPRVLPFLVMLTVFAAGLFISGPVGTLLLTVVAVALGWLLYLSWPVVTPGSRLLRLLVVGLIAGAAVSRLL